MAGFANLSVMDSPLVTWIQTFCDGREAVNYTELAEGVFLNNNVMREIDPRGLDTCGGSSMEERLNTWDTLMKNIKAYYQDVLQQYIVMRLPNVNAICRNPESEKARKELLQVLLLILGCAVQCERKEEFIGNIKQLDIAIQHAIVENIQEITDNNKNVFAIELPEEHQDEVSACLFSHLTSLIRERDGYMEEMKELSQTVEELYLAQQQSEAMKAALSASNTNTTNTTPEKQQHTNMELAETKAKLRKLRQEYEDKVEAVSELVEEVDDARTSINKLRSENSELLHDARSARAYRDELDIFKEKASRVEKYEQEINKYKDRLNELEFFKARVEELREDNGILVETKNMLEDQLVQSQKRIDTIVNLESELLKLQNNVDELTADREIQRQRMEEVLEENVRLELEKKSSFNESVTLEEELVKAKTQLHAGITNSLSTQIGETANARILRLELENQRLQKQVEDARQSAVVENAARTLELEKENHRLAKKVEKLQAGVSKEQQTALQQVVNNADLQRQTIELERTLETVKESNERQIKELECEKEMLEATVETFRERNEKTIDLRVQDIEKENHKMHEKIKETTASVLRLEYENRNFVKMQSRNKENLEKVGTLEDEKMRLENLTGEFQKKIATLQLTCDNYEKLEETVSDLEVDNEKLSKTLVKLNEVVERLHKVEQANINLTVENQALKRNVGNAKQSSSKLAAVEQQKEEFERELQHATRTLESLREVQSKHEQLEMDLLEMDTENQRLQRSLEAKTRHVEELEHDIVDLEGQVEALNKDLDTARMSLRRLEVVEQERLSLEQDAANMNRQKGALDKENKRLKQAAELRAANVDDLTGQVASLTRENREHQKQIERSKEAVARLRELEKENLELAQQTGMDKRTVSTLREDLVQEKIRTQQLTNDLEKLTYDLEKVGIKKEKLALVQDASGPLSDDSKFRALEGLMQDALTKKMELKDEKIHTLQSRLEESVSRNQRLQEDLVGVRRQLAVLDQRREEDALVMTSQGYAKSSTALKREKPLPPPKPTMMTQSATKDILELKDHLIAVERTNASLETENKNLHAHIENLQSRLHQSELQTITARENLSQQQEQFQMLQRQFAKLQVETTMLQAQNSSLHSQNMALQQQHTQLEASHEQLMSTCDELRGTHEALVIDHDSLQNLHEQLTGEYEALISEHGSLKANHKQLRVELKEQQEQENELRREKHMLTELKLAIEHDRETLKSETRSLGNLQMDYVHIKQDNILLKSTHEKVTREYTDLTAEHKAIKAEYNQLQLKYTSQQGQLSEVRNQLNMFDVDISKLASKCEMLSSLNTKLEEENRTLMMQLQALLNQNQELLTQVMDSKDHFHEEERAYRDKLSELRRQKEKLEEKIIEQYKRYDPVKKKNRGFAANLALKARGLFARNRSKERPQTMDGSEMFPHDSTENSSLGSGSMGDTNESPSERIRRAKSSDTLLTSGESPKSGSQHVDNDSMSSENSATRNTEWPSRPARRRHLLDSSGSSLMHQNNYGVYQSSQSSEDPMTDIHDRRDGPDDDDDDSEDNGDMISLNQFLNESNRSPKSRRKLLISKNIDPEEIKTELLETRPEPPPKFLTPRAPIIEDEVKPKTPKSTRKCMQGSKSEMNLSTLSKQTSGSSIGSFAKHNQDMKTSTPKQQYGHGYRGSYGVNHQRGSSNSSQPSHSSGSDGRPSGQSDVPVYATIRPTTSAYSLQQRAIEYNGLERDRSNAFTNDRVNPKYSGSIGRRYSGHIPQPQVPLHKEENPYTAMSGSNQNSPGGGGSNRYARPRQPTASMHGEPREAPPEGYIAIEDSKTTISSGYPITKDNGHPDQSWGYHQSPSMLQSTRQHQPEGSDSQYMPGNVRSLVQTYHMTVKQPPSTTNGGPSSGVPGHQPPVPPPRRMRPMSAGGNLGSSGVPNSNMGGIGSAFTTPRPQSAVPSGYGISGQNSGNNNNNNISSDCDNSLNRPGSTPPRPNPTGREGVPKSSLWYEYGCI